MSPCKEGVQSFELAQQADAISRGIPSCMSSDFHAWQTILKMPLIWWELEECLRNFNEVQKLFSFSGSKFEVLINKMSRT